MNAGGLCLRTLLHDQNRTEARSAGGIVEPPPTVISLAKSCRAQRSCNCHEEKLGRFSRSIGCRRVAQQSFGVPAALDERVMMYHRHKRRAQEPVPVNVADLTAFATNDNAAREGGVCRLAVVAGTGFEPVTFRL